MDYHELIFYQKAQLVVKKINAEIQSWQKSSQAMDIPRQLFRAAVSVGANIAEGHGRHEGAEYIHYLVIAQGSANEIDHWLHTAIDCNLGNMQTLKQIIEINNETRKMLSTTISSLRKNVKSVHEAPAPYSPIPYAPDEENDNL
jgi:four helix bundle protein